MSATHTPWEWDGNPWSYDDAEEAPWLIESGPGGEAILSGELHCRSQADARLIAAAPDLLAALQDVLAWGTDENYERARASCEKARAAIARATGETE
jgi:hypothetical protein